MAVYLDCAATAPLDPGVREVVLHYLDTDYGNAGSPHEYGARARRAVEHARDQVAAAVGARRGEVVFTSGATEANNLALLGLAEWGMARGRRHLVSTAIEHSAVLQPLRALETRGFTVTLVPPGRKGGVEPEAVRDAMRDETLLVSVMDVNNETGVRQPLDEIARLLGDHPAYFHTDAAQGFGRQGSPLRNPRIDMVSLSGHKIHAPKGVGALVVRRRDGERPPLAPLLHGGGQERGLRPGTLPVPLVAGLGKAAELTRTEGPAWAEQCLRFRKRLLDALAPLRPRVHGDPERCVPHIVNLSLPALLSEEVLEAAGEVVALSDGAACTAQSHTCSHVLHAMGVAREDAAGALRFSWCHLTPEPDWDRLVSVLSGLQAIAAAGEAA